MHVRATWRKGKSAAQKSAHICRDWGGSGSSRFRGRTMEYDSVKKSVAWFPRGQGALTSDYSRSGLEGIQVRVHKPLSAHPPNRTGWVVSRERRGSVGDPDASARVGRRPLARLHPRILVVRVPPVRGDPRVLAVVRASHLVVLVETNLSRVRVRVRVRRSAG